MHKNLTKAWDAKLMLTVYSAVS